MPSIRDMFINLSGTALDVYNTVKERGVVLADSQTSMKRIDACLNCPHFIVEPGPARCGVCGCGMKIKVRLAAARCPLNPPVWGAMSPDEIEKMKKEGAPTL